jgi:hypothetical protein
MFKSARQYMPAIVMLGVAAALVVGGVAAAQGSSQPASKDSQSAGSRPPGMPPFGGPMLMTKGLTYADVHVQRDGKAETIRIDQGEIAAVDGSSITLTENDGSEVTIPVDGDTKVIGKPEVTVSSEDGRKGMLAKPAESTLADLENGQQATVSAPQGGTAESIMVLPRKGEMTGAPMGGPMPLPPGQSSGSSGE